MWPTVNGMVAIAALGCGRESWHTPGLGLGEYTLEGDRRDMMALVHDDMSVVGDAKV